MIVASHIKASSSGDFFKFTINPLTSHEKCFSDVTYVLCNIGTLEPCPDQNLWSETNLVEIDGDNNLVIQRTPFSKREVFLQAKYPLGNKIAFRKLSLAVCGTESV